MLAEVASFLDRKGPRDLIVSEWHSSMNTMMLQLLLTFHSSTFVRLSMIPGQT